MLDYIRITKIDSDLSDARLEDGCRTTCSLKFDTNVGDGYSDVSGKISIVCAMVIIFEQECSDSDDFEEITRCSVTGLFVYRADGATKDSWSDDQLNDFCSNSFDEIYIHMYNKMGQVFVAHGVTALPIPPSYKGFRKPDSNDV